MPDKMENVTENVLVMQGGGSLGAYECGVYKSLAKHKIEFDVVAGTSIGATNAAIIAAHKGDDPAKSLEDFWHVLAETTTPSSISNEYRKYFSSMYAAFWGNQNIVQPLWMTPNLLVNSFNQPYFYDKSPLKKTLEGFVDFSKLKEKSRPRLLVTSTDMQNSKPVVFDSKFTNMNADHILASCGYPFYGISWTEIDGKFLWDGALLSNTPLREVIDASPRTDKNVYIVNLFPHKQDHIPENMMESWHRARDIMYTDKTDHNVKMSKIMTRHLSLIKTMYEILDSSELDEQNRKKFDDIKLEYHKIAKERGAIIRKILRVERNESMPYLFEDADFSLKTIKGLIQEGELDADDVLKKSNR